MVTNDLGELFTDDFLDSLDADSVMEQNAPAFWVINDKDHTTYKAFHAILELKELAEKAIDNFGSIETQKTPKFYQLKKSHVARLVGVSAQSIFNTSSFSPHIRAFFDDINSELLKRHQAEQKKQVKRKKSGIRKKKKEELVVSHQSIEKRYNALVALKTAEVLKLSIENMPIDLKAKLGL